jgi:hypothetical protein
METNIAFCAYLAELPVKSNKFGRAPKSAVDPEQVY